MITSKTKRSRKNKTKGNGIFILNVQVLMALVIAIKTIAQFAATFEKVYLTL